MLVSLLSLVLECFSLFLGLVKLLSGFVSEVYKSTDSGLLLLLPVLLLHLLDEGSLVYIVVVVIGVIELKHAIGGAVRIIPDKLLWLVEVFILEEVLLGRQRVWQYSFEVVLL